MRQVHPQAPVAHLRLVEDLGEVIDRPARHLCHFECGEPFAGGALAQEVAVITPYLAQPGTQFYVEGFQARAAELGFTVNGAFANYIAVGAKYCWSVDGILERFGDKGYEVAALTEPTCVAYTGVIVRGGGIKPGDNVVICGSGPVGLAAVAILKRAGAAKVILSEPEPARAELGRKLGADEVINPLKEDMKERVLEITHGMGAKLYLEATGLPTVVYPQIEACIWEGRSLNATVVVVARADAKIPVTGEVLQVRRAQIVGTQGHSGDGTFPHVIESMASGMNMLPVITKEVTLDQLPENIVALRTEKKESKISCVNP